MAVLFFMCLAVSGVCPVSARTRISEKPRSGRRFAAFSQAGYANALLQGSEMLSYRISNRTPYPIGEDVRDLNPTSVESRVPVVTRFDNRTIEGQAAVQALCRSPDDDVAREIGRRRGFRAGAESDHRETQTGADLELAARDGFKRAIAHDQHDDFGFLEPGLQTKGRRAERVESG